jgi:hypothetical protein
MNAAGGGGDGVQAMLLQLLLLLVLGVSQPTVGQQPTAVGRSQQAAPNGRSSTPPHTQKRPQYRYTVLYEYRSSFKGIVS